MTRFLDGPVAGAQLMLSRSPLFVRVTVAESTSGPVIDCLDMLDDEPAEGEVLYAYRREGKPTAMHISYTSSKTRRREGKVLRAADYQVVPVQPPMEVMASSEKWQAWCLAQWKPEQQVGAREE